MTGGVHFVTLNRSVVRIYAAESHVVAEIVTAFNTQEALAAGYTRLNGNSITYATWLVWWHL